MQSDLWRSQAKCCARAPEKTCGLIAGLTTLYALFLLGHGDMQTVQDGILPTGTVPKAHHDHRTVAVKMALHGFCLGTVHHLSASQVYTMPVPPSRITFMSPDFLPGCSNAVSGSSFRPSGSPDSVPLPDAAAALAFRSANEASYTWCQSSQVFKHLLA